MSEHPCFSTLPDGRRVQRLDTFQVPAKELIGREVHHPHMQVGDSQCGWTKEEVIALEWKLCGHSFTETDEWFPDIHDIGILVEVFTDKDFPDRTRGRFKDADRMNDPSHGGLHYDLVNLWLVVEEDT